MGRRRGGSDPPASPQFCASWHQPVRELDAALAPEGMAKFGMDDGYCVGYPSTLFPALLRFARKVEEKCNIQLNLRKCEVFTWSGQLPAGTPHGMTLAGVEVEGVWEDGCLVYGVPVGKDRYVAALLDKKVDDIARKAVRTCQVLEGEDQALWAVRGCLYSRSLAIGCPWSTQARQGQLPPGWTWC